MNLIDPPTRYVCEAMPRNAVTFAYTGGDFVHFSLIEKNGGVSDDSPVVMTSPSAGQTPWEQNFLVGENLREFLELGCLAGYGQLEDLASELFDAMATRLIQAPSEIIYPETDNTLSVFRRELSLAPVGDLGRRLIELEDMKESVLEFA